MKKKTGVPVEDEALEEVIVAVEGELVLEERVALADDGAAECLSFRYLGACRRRTQRTRADLEAS